MRAIFKFIVEFGPLLTFFLLFKFYDIFHATIGIMIATLITTVISFCIDKKISYLPLFTFSLIAIFGGITIYTGDTQFIKIKPTVINLLFFTILMGGAFFKKGLLKPILGNALKMTEENWLIFSRRWALFFLFVAGLNEFVWRNFSENFWVNFKVFGIIGLTSLFLISQFRFINLAKIE